MKILISVYILSLSLMAFETIKVTQKQQRDLGIRTQTVSAIQNIYFGPYNGLVVLDKKDILFISSKLESKVTDIYVRELENVKKGQKLMTLESNKLLSLQQNYLEAIFENQLANQNYERNIKLQTKGIISNKRLLESEKIKKSADLKVALTSQHLLSNGFSSGMLRELKKDTKPVYMFNMYATRSGVVKKVNVNIGEYISSEHKMIEIYADGKRFIEITIPVKNVKSISLGDEVHFADFRAKITVIGKIVNNHSQSLLMRASILKVNDVMINRVYETRIQKKVTGVYKIKKTAIVFNQSKPLVFKKVAQGFEVLKVIIVKEGPSCYIVRADLNIGDEVATRSTAALLSAMELGDE